MTGSTLFYAVRYPGSIGILGSFCFIKPIAGNCIDMPKRNKLVAAFMTRFWAKLVRRLRRVDVGESVVEGVA
jgi:hypothetical protein